MQTEQAVKMAAKLYECRDTAKRVFGDGYHKRMEAYGQVVKSAANALNCSDVAAATTLANKAGGGMAAICYLAAVVEMTEPSNATFANAAAGSLRFYGAVSASAMKHAEELAGAAEMVGSWADELDKEKT